MNFFKRSIPLFARQREIFFLVAFLFSRVSASNFLQVALPGHRETRKPGNPNRKIREAGKPETRKPRNPQRETRKSDRETGKPETRKPKAGNAEIRPGNRETGNPETREPRAGNAEIRPGNRETGKPENRRPGNPARKTRNSEPLFSAICRYFR